MVSIWRDLVLLIFKKQVFLLADKTATTQPFFAVLRHDLNASIFMSSNFHSPELAYVRQQHIYSQSTED